MPAPDHLEAEVDDPGGLDLGEEGDGDDESAA
jgi:hypothetical protein